MIDPQSRAFRDANSQQWDETTLVDSPHAALDDLEPDPGSIRTVEGYEADGWDAERAGPKTLDQARENLAARIADPACPDTASQAGAYDDLEPDDDGDRFADEDGGA